MKNLVKLKILSKTLNLSQVYKTKTQLLIQARHPIF